ncbi:MAG: hypothetical protein QGH76_02730 [Phycisphaerales bacterium]|nr:hypothetical protein [Phycisphaerales bacterium]
MIRAAGALSGLVGGLLVAGCASSGGPVAVDGMWAYAPEHMQVHPLTRHDADNNTLEVRIELLDNDDVSCRGIGTLEVVANRPNGGLPLVERISIDLDNPETNLATYDDVTRTYRVTVPLDNVEVLPDQVALKVTFTPRHRGPMTVTRRISMRSQ